MHLYERCEGKMTIAERNTKLKAFITCLKCRISGKYHNDNCSTQYKAGNMGEIIDNLEAISKALEQESKTGHWIVAKGGSHMGVRNACCSNCKDFYTNDWNVMNYCPNCGAKIMNYK